MDEIPKITKCVVNPSLITDKEGLRKDLAVAVLYLIKEVLKFSNKKDVNGADKLCQDLLAQTPNVNFETSVYQVFEELFAEGISWYKIATLFAFCHILATKTTVSLVESSLRSYISDYLFKWVSENGGWNGLIILANKCSNNYCIAPDQNNEGN
ncbi:BCL2-like protein, Cell death inhibitor [Armadillidium vulgare iridescent virus]|uniref:BCL2-like protein, Cell death inhibitor n=1 Tax=Armadillidium vulgare iridescent virus TaxID=72201 RepID=A0A068QLP8_9VIRU|nr:BCL2-like protein, Cell death inhibitor [Armadillidium vulgare iridescent virus]CCV02454.1 BCL2-like protein, Cell death inhibitor [Armadillidium vulgare iridescent virus]